MSKKLKKMKKEIIEVEEEKPKVVLKKVRRVRQKKYLPPRKVQQVGRIRRKREKRQLKNEYLESEPEQKLLGIEMNILGEGEVINTPTSGIPQRQVIENNCELDVNVLIELAYTWSVYAASRGVLPQETVLTDVGSVGILYMTAITIAYDLYYACTGTYSVFKTAPQSYWELRAAITPKNLPGFSYTWNLPDTFFDFIGSFPLTIGSCSISWPVGPYVPQAVMNTAIPALTDEIIAAEGVQACQRVWTELDTRGHEGKMVVQPETTVFDKTTAAFVLARQIGGSGDLNELRRWTVFYHEVPVGGQFRWLAFLGLCNDTSNNIRIGPHVYTDFAGAQHYAHRVNSGDVGLQPFVVLRIKTIYIEDFFNFTMSALTAGDLHMADVMGRNVVDQAVDMPNSPFASISPGTMAFGLFNQIMRRVSAISWIGFSSIPCDDCSVLAGVLACPDSTVINSVYLTALNETIASLTPIKNKKNGWNFVTYPQMVTVGGFVTANIFENSGSGNPDDLSTQVLSYFPSFDTLLSSYTFGGDSIGLPDYINFSDTTLSWVLGEAIPLAIVAVSNVFNTLQGNLAISSPEANLHTLRTVIYYTRICEKEEDDENEYSNFQTAVINGISNRVPFDPNMVSVDLSGILPVTFAKRPVYQSIYSETSSVSYSSLPIGDGVLLTDVVSMGGAEFAHPVAGGDYETNIVNENSICQHQGGGFDFLKNLVPIATDLISSFFPI